MQRVLLAALVLGALLLCGADALKGPNPPRRKVGSNTQLTAVSGLISRFVSKDVAAAFDLAIISQQANKDVMQVTPLGKGRIQLSGSSGVAVAAAFYWYLKVLLLTLRNLTLQNACNAMITWNQTQINISTPLPQISGTVTFVTPYTFRYYYNVCTFGYTSVWWGWERWQRELDWAAMNGINLPLAMVGQEAVWQQVYTQLGFNETDLSEFFTGPAYLPWNRMGNVYDWQGPLSQNWISNQKALQLQILTYMRAIGMTPVLPAFAGHVPYTFSAQYPNSNVSMLSPWNSFPGTTYLDPQDSMYRTIGTMYIEAQTTMYGTDHFYNCDPFNEVEPPTNDPAWLAASGAAIYSAMTTADPYAVWVMQGWFLFNAASFWQQPQAQAFLNSVPVDGLLMLDLFAEVSPVWNRTQSFYGRSFIWCMLHNFGGRTGMYATLPSVASGPAGALAQTDFIQGIGMTPEALETNYITYDLLTYQIWTNTTVTLDTFVPDFATRRYGIVNTNTSNAWTALQESVFNCIPEVNICHGTVPSLAARRPSFILTNLLYVREDLNDHLPKRYYNPAAVIVALDNLLSAEPLLADVDMYQYDLVEVTRQALVNVHVTLYYALIASYNANDLPSVQGNASLILSLMNDLDTLVGTRREWLLGTWVADAIALASTPEESVQFELNARTQLTLWGYPTSDLYDYAGKLWSGLIHDFYIPRWTIFLQQVTDSVQFNYSFPLLACEDQIITFEENWITQHKVYPTVPSGNPILTSQTLIAKWKNLFPAI